MSSLKVSEVGLTFVSTASALPVIDNVSNLRIAEAGLTFVSRQDSPNLFVQNIANLRVAEVGLVSVSKQDAPDLTIRNESNLQIAEVGVTTVHRERAFYVQVESHVSGTVCSTNQDSKSTIVAISLEGECVGKAEAQTDGTFTIDTSPYEGTVVLLRYQNYGDAFTSKFYNENEVVHPTPPNGNIYEVASAGQSGEVEPDWTTGTVVSGNVVFRAVPLFQPTAAGYVNVTVES